MVPTWVVELPTTTVASVEAPRVGPCKVLLVGVGVAMFPGVEGGNTCDKRDVRTLEAVWDAAGVILQGQLGYASFKAKSESTNGMHVVLCSFHFVRS